MIKASVVIITKNNEEQIVALLEALSYQDFKNFEVIIIDLCSTDKTLDKASEFPVKVFRLESSRRFPMVLNLASKICVGETIFSLSGRNIPRYNSFISSGLQILKSYQIAMTFGPKFIENEAPIVKILNIKEWFSFNKQIRNIKSREIKNIDVDNCAYKKSVWQKIPFSDDEETSIWRWSNEIIKNKLKIKFNPFMAIGVKEKTGLINYLQREAKRNKKYKYFEESIKNELLN